MEPGQLSRYSAQAMGWTLEISVFNLNQGYFSSDQPQHRLCGHPRLLSNWYRDSYPKGTDASS
jgi:hypothetical protein